MSKRRSREKSKKTALFFLLLGIAIVLTILGVTIQQLLIGMMVTVGVIITLAIIIAILNLPSVKGKRGERKIARLLGSFVVNEDTYVINDVIVANDSGKTSQIDHILFARGGIFVIETKNYSGRIYGQEDDKEWTQVLAYGKTKNKFYNPIKQNQTHVYRLKQILGKDLPFASCIVFLRADTSRVVSGSLFTPRQLKKFLKREAFDLRINSDDLYDAYKKILDFKQNPVQSKKEHVHEIKHAKKAINKYVCPRCGGTLLLRHSKDGRMFYGCSNYPKCTFTKNKI